jgi:hypothetical protein
MRIKTTNDVIVLKKGQPFNEYYMSNADYSNAIGTSTGTGATVKSKDSTKTPVKKAKFFSKEKRAERKENRIEKRAERRAKRGARPLKQVGAWFKDHLPRVKKNNDGSYTKATVNGQETVDPKNVASIGSSGILVDKSDAKGRDLKTEVINGVQTAVVNYAQGEVEKLIGDNGQEAVYAKDDVDTGMSMGAKIGIAVGIAVTLGTIIYLVKRNK